MAKLCSSYGLSSFATLPDWPFSAFDEFSIKPDPIELFDELKYPSIQSDIQKIESDSGSICGTLSLLDGFDLDLKPEINTDCMWGSNTRLSSSASSSLSDNCMAIAVPLAVVSQPQPTMVVASQRPQNQQQQFDMKPVFIKTEPGIIKTEPIDDYEQQIPMSKTAVQQQSMQHIPPGTSLLRKSNPQQQQQQQQQRKLQQQQKQSSIQIPNMGASAFLRERDQLLAARSSLNVATNKKSIAAATTTAAGVASTAYIRPDTPHSLDDDGTSEFKFDISACLMGSNNISLTADATNFINHVSQELQDTSKSQIDMRFTPACNSLDEVLNVIVKDNQFNASNKKSTASAAAAAKSGKIIYSGAMQLRNSDCDDSDEESMGDSSCGSSSSTLLDSDLSYVSTSPVSGQSSSNNGSSSLHRHQQPYSHSDHSYTRCKDGMDDLGTNLETPSDSDEEIDVVSIGDKKLPTNPSDKDRRALQTKVAYKFSNARIVKTPNGVRTIPPRRRVSYEFPYTPASSSPVKSVANTRYPSPASTPYQLQYTTKYVQQQQQQQQQQQMLAVLPDGSTAPINVINEKPRKRVLAPSGGIINGVEYALPAGKKHRGKKVKYSEHGSNKMQGLLKRHYSLDEAADTLEKRNLHNDMERQRRIGLKNLFEALKKQIPSIKDKERAPKVTILREAAKLCETLVREDQQMNEQRALLKEQTRKRQEVLARLRAQQRD